MNRLHFNTIFLFLPLVLFSCKKDKLEGEKTILIGKWNWVYSDVTVSYCNPPTSDKVITPITEGVTYSIEFDKKGKIYFYENGSISDKKRIIFKIWRNAQHSNFLNNPNNRNFGINLNNNENSISGEVSKDTLMLYPYYFPFDDSDGCNYHWSYFVKE